MYFSLKGCKVDSVISSLQGNSVSGTGVRASVCTSWGVGGLCFTAGGLRCSHVCIAQLRQPLADFDRY
jgi:hypothetical protein